MDHVVSRRRARTLALAVCMALLAVPAAASAATPTASTLPADTTLLTDTYALISGVINPGGSQTVYWFEWGRTTSYGQGTPITQAGNGSADVPVDYSLDSLKPSTTYHYRLIAKPASGNDIVGADQTFTTAPALAISFTGTTSRLSDAGKALVALKAVGPTDSVAKGVLKFTTRIKGQVRSLGTATYSLEPGQSKTIAVRVNAVGRDALKAAKSHRLDVLATAKTSGIKKAVLLHLTLTR